MKFESKQNHFQYELEIVDQWSTMIPQPSRRGSSGQCVDCNWTLFKITRILSTHIHMCNVLLKFDLDIQSQINVKSPETEKSNMATRQPFWKWHLWKSIGLFTWLLYIFVVVNFDALAQASDIRIERRQVVFLCWRQDSNPRSQIPIHQQTECLLTNRLSYRGSS